MDVWTPTGLTARIDVLVTGSRDWPFPGIIENALWTYRLQFPNHEMCIIHGDNPHGADAIANEYAHRMHWKVESFPANWSAVGRRAGHLRNAQMRDRLLCSRPDNHPMCIGFCMDWSRGTMDMVTLAREAELPVTFFSATHYEPGRIKLQDSQGGTRNLIGDYRKHFAISLDSDDE